MGVPVKPFGVAKARLGPVLDARSRSVVGRAVAARTAAAAERSGCTVAVVTGDPGVARWARRLGYEVVDETAGGPGLDGAARSVALEAARRGMRWAIVHADLPLATSEDLSAVFVTAPAIAPSRDGGTNVIVGAGTGFPFSYGPGSFHRHLAAAPGARVVTRPGLALDLDTPGDLARARRAAAGAWLSALDI